MQIVTNKHQKNLLNNTNFLNFSKFRVYLLPKRDLKSSYQYKISFRIMFCRPSTAILLLARLKIFSFLLHILTLKIAPFFAKIWIFTPPPPPPGGTSKAPPILLKFCTHHFFMHVPLFITSHLDLKKQVKNDTPYCIALNRITPMQNGKWISKWLAGVNAKQIKWISTHAQSLV